MIVHDCAFCDTQMLTTASCPSTDRLSQLPVPGWRSARVSCKHTLWLNPPIVHRFFLWGVPERDSVLWFIFPPTFPSCLNSQLSQLFEMREEDVGCLAKTGGRREKTRSGEIVNELLLKGKYCGKWWRLNVGRFPVLLHYLLCWTFSAFETQFSIWVISNRKEKKTNKQQHQRSVLNYRVFAFLKTRNKQPAVKSITI